MRSAPPGPRRCSLASRSRRYGPSPSPAAKTARAPDPLPTSATRAGLFPRRAAARATSGSVVRRGVITSPGAVRSRTPANVVASSIVSIPICAPRGAAHTPARELRDLLTGDKRAQALVFLAARRAAVEVGAQAGNRRICILADTLELDVAVQLVEALVAAKLGLRWAE